MDSNNDATRNANEMQTSICLNPWQQQMPQSSALRQLQHLAQAAPAQTAETKASGEYMR